MRIQEKGTNPAAPHTGPTLSPWWRHAAILVINRKTATTPEVNLRGVERYAFRLEIDSESGALNRATTTADNLDLVVAIPGLPPDRARRMAITREVTIARKD